jgi:hypothetical protein
VREPIIESSAPENSSRKSFLGENAAVPAESSGKRPHRHTVELASRRWRGGHDSAGAETRRDNLTETLGLTSGILGKSILGACQKINQ